MGAEPWLTSLIFAAAAVLGVAGLVVVALALFRDRSRGRPRCPRCWYSMEGLDLVCPECGHACKSHRGLHRTRRRWRWATLGMVLIAGGVGAGLAPTLRSKGIAPLVPTTVMILGSDWIDPVFLGKHLPPRVDRGLWAWQKRMLARRATGEFASPDADRRRWAVRVMHELADELRPAPDPYADLLSDTDTQVRDFAAGVLRIVAPTGDFSDLIPKVYAAMLGETQYWTALRLGSTLGHFGDAALPALAAAASHADPSVRERAMWGLGHLATTNATAAEALAAAMADPAANVRYRAVHAVGQNVAPAARARVIESLREASADPDANVASVAAMRLELLSPADTNGIAP